jgi:predicted O-methyltransferase YrrM
MSSRTMQMSSEFTAYLHENWLRDSELQKRLRQETATLGNPAGMQISPEQGQLMGFLVEVTGARNILEVGTFTGYSALAMALALEGNGKIVTCDTSEEWTEMARRYWQEAGVADQIELHLAPALETIDGLLREGKESSFDLVFIDADKENYDHYYERSLKLLRPGGVILFDNVFWSGRVADPTAMEPSTVSIRALNAKLHGDERVSLAIVPIGDGLTLVRKRR